MDKILVSIAGKLESIESSQRFAAMAELHEAEKALKAAQERHARAKVIYERWCALRPVRRKARR